MTYFSMIPAEAYNLIGMVGFGLYVLNYVCLTAKKISADHTLYFVVNLLASGMVLVSLASAFNLASAMIQVFWVAISIVGIVTRLRPAMPPKQPAPRALPAETQTRLAAIETQTGPRFVSQRRPAVRWPDGSPGIYSRGLGSERRTQHPVKG